MAAAQPNQGFSHIQFEVNYRTRHGERLFVVGSAQALGNWETDKAVELWTTPDDYPIHRSKAIGIARNAEVHYQFFLASGVEFSRYGGKPRTVCTSEYQLTIKDNFDSDEPPAVTGDTTITVSRLDHADDPQPVAPEDASASSPDPAGGSARQDAAGDSAGDSAAEERRAKKLPPEDMTPEEFDSHFRSALGQRRIYTLMFRLPVIVTRVPAEEAAGEDEGEGVAVTGAAGYGWRVDWEPDSYLARDPFGSAADAADVRWVGFITRDCFQQPKAATSMPRSPSEAAPATDGASVATNAEGSISRPPVTRQASEEEAVEEEESVRLTVADRQAIERLLRKRNVFPIFMDDAIRYIENNHQLIDDIRATGRRTGRRLDAAAGDPQHQRSNSISSWPSPDMLPTDPAGRSEAAQRFQLPPGAESLDPEREGSSLDQSWVDEDPATLELEEPASEDQQLQTSARRWVPSNNPRDVQEEQEAFEAARIRRLRARQQEEGVTQSPPLLPATSDFVTLPGMPGGGLAAPPARPSPNEPFTRSPLPTSQPNARPPFAVPEGPRVQLPARPKAASISEQDASAPPNTLDARLGPCVASARSAVPLQHLFAVYHEYIYGVLRPCLHNVLEAGNRRVFARSEHVHSIAEQGWWAFKVVNACVSAFVAQQLKAGDIVWTNDYTLCLVPRYLQGACRALRKPRPYGQLFFMHQPWPTSEIFRALAPREALLRGILAADVVGFHTFNHARHFLHSCKRILGMPFSSRQGKLVVYYHGKDVSLAISHVGVEPQMLDQLRKSAGAAASARAIRARHPNKTIIAGVDSCQRLSGVVLKLLAFEHLLQTNQTYALRTVLVQRVEFRGSRRVDYEQTSAEIRVLVDRINAQYGPNVVDYEESRSRYSAEYRMGLFHQADVFLHTPVREGLNLITLEYVYARTRWELERAAKLHPGLDGAAGTLPAQPAEPAGMPLSYARVAGQEVEQGRCGASPLSVGTSSVEDSPVPSGWPAHGASIGNIREEDEGEEEEEEGDGSADSDEEEQEEEDAGFPGHTVSGALDDSADQEAAAFPTLAAPLRPRRSQAERLASRSMPNLAAAARCTPRTPLSVSRVADLTAPLPPPPRGGCVVLSEFATASHMLNSSLQVNPYAPGSVAASIEGALRMTDAARAANQWKDYQYCISHPSGAWSRLVLADLVETLQARSKVGAYIDFDSVDLQGRAGASANPMAHTMMVGAEGGKAELSLLNQEATGSAYGRAQHRLLIFDYAGTLMEQESDGVYVKHSFLETERINRRMPRPALEALERISRQPNTTVVVIANLQMAVLNNMYLAQIPTLTLAAERGNFIRWGYGTVGVDEPSDEAAAAVGAESFQRPWRPRLAGPTAVADDSWPVAKEMARAIMNAYVWALDGTELIELEHSLTWDYHDADPSWVQEQASFCVNELLAALHQMSSIRVVQTSTTVVVFPSEHGKGAFVRWLLESPVGRDADFVMSVGDDKLDEESFKAVDDRMAELAGQRRRSDDRPFRYVYTVRVGRKPTRARYYLRDVAEVQSMIKLLGTAERTAPQLAVPPVCAVGAVRPVPAAKVPDN